MESQRTEKGPDPNADQISSAPPWNNPARSPFSSACGAKHGARGGRRHGDVPGRSFALPKTSLSRVWPAFFGCEVSSNKCSIQKLSVPPSPPCLAPQAPSIKGKALSDQHSGQTPPGPDGCSEGPAPLPGGGRHLAAPWRMLGGRMSHAKSAKLSERGHPARDFPFHSPGSGGVRPEC